MSDLHKYLAEMPSANTRRAYRRDVLDFLGDRDDVVEASQGVRPGDVGDWLRGMRRDGLSTSTQRRRLAAVRRWFDWLVETGRHDRNPARTCRETPRAPDQRPSESPELSRQDVQALLDAAVDGRRSAIRDAALILTIVAASLRRSEVAALKVKHVRPLGRHWVIDLPEGETWGSVYVRIPEAVSDAINLVCTHYGIAEGALWRSTSNRNAGAPMTADAIYKVVRDVGQRAGIDGVTIDALRDAGLRMTSEGGATLSQTQAHGRLQHAASAARYVTPDETRQHLTNSAVDFLDLPALPGMTEDDVDETSHDNSESKSESKGDV